MPLKYDHVCWLPNTWQGLPDSTSTPPVAPAPTVATSSCCCCCWHVIAVAHTAIYHSKLPFCKLNDQQKLQQQRRKTGTASCSCSCRCSCCSWCYYCCCCWGSALLWFLCQQILKVIANSWGLSTCLSGHGDTSVSTLR